MFGNQFTLLTMACSSNVSPDIGMSLIGLLLEFDVDVNQFDPDGRSGLWYGLSNADKNLSLLLLEHGAVVDEVLIDYLLSQFTSNPVELDQLISVMIQQNVITPFINLPFEIYSSRNTFLHELISRSKGYHRIEATLRQLDRIGFEWNLQNMEGDTVLHLAFNMDSDENERDLPELWLVELLLSFEPRLVVMENNKGHTVFSYFQDTIDLKIFLDSDDYIRELREDGYCEDDEEWGALLAQRAQEIRKGHQPLLDLLLRVRHEVLST